MMRISWRLCPSALSVKKKPLEFELLPTMSTSSLARSGIFVDTRAAGDNSPEFVLIMIGSLSKATALAPMRHYSSLVVDNTLL